MVVAPNITLGMHTDPGRKTVNEDAYYVLEDRVSPEGPVLNGLYAVADADSSDKMGEAAARLLLSTIAEIIEPFFNQEHESYLVELKKAVQEGYRRLKDLSSHEEWKGINVSLACALVSGFRLFYTIVGSCSIYHLRNGEMKELSGGMPAQESAPEGQEGQEEPALEVFELKLAPGDTLLLASDGLGTKVRPAEIAEVLHWSVSAQASCDRLITLAKRSGGEDNITALAVDLLEERKPKGDWWKYLLGILAMLIVGFFLSFLFFSRREAGPPPTESPTETSSSRYRFIEDLRDPYAVIFWDKYLFVLDKEEKRVRKFSDGQEVSQFNGYMPAAEAPCDMVGSSRYIFVLDAAGKFFSLSPEGGNPVMLVPEMGDHGTLSSPRALEGDGRYFYVADRGNDRVVVFNGDFKYVGEYSGQNEDGSPLIEKPNGLAIDEQGYLYVSLKNRHQILKLDKDGGLVAQADTGATSIGTYDGPADLALTFSGDVLVPEMSTNQILVFDPDLNLKFKISGTQLQDSAFRDPKGLCASAEALYVAGGFSDDLEGYVWRIPWSLFTASP